MRIIQLFCFFVLGFQISNAQSIFEKYHQSKEVSYLNVSPKMFELLGKLNISSSDSDTQKYMEAIKNISSFKLMSTNSDKISKEVEEWLEEEKQRVGLNLLFSSEEEELSVQFYTVHDEEKDKIKQLIMYVQTDGKSLTGKNISLDTKCILLNLKGDIDLENIAGITEVIDLPGGAFLKKI